MVRLLAALAFVLAAAGDAQYASMGFGYPHPATGTFGVMSWVSHAMLRFV